MRHLLTVLIATLVTAGCGLALCATMGWSIKAAPVLIAGSVAVLASGLALVPMLLTRGADQAARAQAALVATLVHMLGCLGGAAVLLVVVKTMPGAAYWLLAFYWTTLAALVVGLAREVRAAPVADAAQKP